MAGVCSGLAVHLGVPVMVIRGGLIALTFLGVGAVAYLWLWVTVPEDSPEASASGTLSPGLVRVRQERAAQVARNRMIVTGVALLVAAVLGAILNATSALEWSDMGSIVSIIAGITLVWSQSREVRNWRSLRFIGAVLGGIMLLSLGVVMVASRDNPPVILLRGGLIGAALVAGVLFALVPMWLRTTKDLSQAQAQRVREAERADIAAHLHDSVLQTLTLIRASAEDPARVRAIALTEERELRAWLYTDRPAPGTSVADAFTDLAGEIEDRYGVAVDAVCVGDRAPDRDTEVIVAAAREALEEADVRIEVRRLLSVEVVGPVTYYNGDVTTYLDVAFAAQWVSGEPSPADGENSETAFFRADQLPPMNDRFRRAVAKALSGRLDADFLTA